MGERRGLLRPRRVQAQGLSEWGWLIPCKPLCCVFGNSQASTERRSLAGGMWISGGQLGALAKIYVSFLGCCGWLCLFTATGWPAGQVDAVGGRQRPVASLRAPACCCRNSLVGLVWAVPGTGLAGWMSLSRRPGPPLPARPPVSACVRLSLFRHHLLGEAPSPPLRERRLCLLAHELSKPLSVSRVGPPPLCARRHPLSQALRHSQDPDHPETA